MNAQFDPVASREGFAASRLNEQLVPLVADLWAAATLDVLGTIDPAAWHAARAARHGCVHGSPAPGHRREALLERARDQVASEPFLAGLDRSVAGEVHDHDPALLLAPGTPFAGSGQYRLL
ncbi:hypothetical protein ACFOZ0_17125 [Streptomyces yaanensis]|uniref:Uncharacterized protein n=1 Tax=Streptomyces yaanensis TaxID=1142239 RepID=A0ABV7SGI8_9ACTN|nr:hypothetical protein [Streptomyces sp. CGMCC 4.7035]WNB98229.1 hypothetical protein Q2K21_09170 [Streptomyces sp. CGMCC 4.7035]